MIQLIDKLVYRMLSKIPKKAKVIRNGQRHRL
jgi:hypothetical protein